MCRLGIGMIVSLMSLLPWDVAGSDKTNTFIPAPQAIRKLNSLRGQYVRVVLADQNGDKRVFHSCVDPKYDQEDLVAFYRTVLRRPEAEISLTEEYVQENLVVPITTKYGQEIVNGLRWGPKTFKLKKAGQTIEYGNDQYLVLSIEPLDLTGPKVSSRLIVTSRTVPDNDPWIGSKSGQKSNREFVYQLTGSDKEYRYRIRWNQSPKLCSISSIKISPPGYFYYSPIKYERGIELLVTYTDHHNGKLRRKDRGFIELDEEGYPTGGHYVRAPFLDKALFAEVAQTKKASKPDEPAFAGQLPTEMRLKQGDVDGRLARSSNPLQSVKMNKNVAERTELRPLSEKQAVSARADIRRDVRGVRRKLLFSDPIPKYLTVVTKGKFDFFQRGASQGWPEAQFMVSMCLFHAVHCDKNQQMAIDELMPFVRQRDPDATLAVASMKLERSFHSGDSAEADSAIKLLNALVEWKDPVGLTMLAQCYQYGDGGVTQDTSKAFDLWEMAAEQNAPLGLYMMGVQADAQGKKLKASRLFQQSAMEGYTLAEFTFGERCFFGIGWGNDYDAAFSWYQKAASKGHVEAQVRVADCYEIGAGVAQDWERARALRDSAIKQGSFLARKNAAIAELNHAMSHFLTLESNLEEVALQRAFRHHRALKNESDPEAQLEFEELQTVFKRVMTRSLSYAENKESIPVPIPKLTEEELEEMRLRETIEYSALMANSLELQHSIFDGRPGAHAVRMAEQDQELAKLRSEILNSPLKPRAIPKLERSAAAKRFAELWAEPLAKAIYSSNSPEYHNIVDRCRVVLLK